MQLFPKIRSTKENEQKNEVTEALQSENKSDMPFNDIIAQPKT